MTTALFLSLLFTFVVAAFLSGPPKRHFHEEPKTLERLRRRGGS